MSINVSQAIRDMREAAPEEARTVGLMRAMAKEMDRFAYKAKTQIAVRFAVDSSAITALVGLVSMNPAGAFQALMQVDYAVQVQDVLEDLTEARERARFYVAALEGLPDDSTDIPAEVRPLFYNVVGETFVSPDYLAPVYALNRYDAFDEDVRSFWGDMLKFVVESAKDFGTGLRNYGPYILGAAAIIGAAVYFRR